MRGARERVRRLLLKVGSSTELQGTVPLASFLAMREGAQETVW